MRRRARQNITFHQFRLFAFGSDEELIAGFGSLEKAERAWESVRDEFLERWNLWGMPEAWWRFEPEIPADLRRGPHAIVASADAAEWERIDDGRRAYLSSKAIEPRRRGRIR